MQKGNTSYDQRFSQFSRGADSVCRVSLLGARVRYSFCIDASSVNDRNSSIIHRERVSRDEVSCARVSHCWGDPGTFHLTT